MGQAWGLTGPEFLALYGAGLVLALGWAALVRWRVRRPQEPVSWQPLDVAELAFLVGGPGRAAEAAVARLVEAGRVHAARNGQLTRAAGHTAHDPLDAAVLRELDRAPRMTGTVLRKVTASPAATAIGDRLVQQRLLVAPAAARSARRRAVAGLYLLFLIGLVRLGDGVWHDRPVGFLAVLLVLTVALAIPLRNRRVKARTVHGDRVVASAQGGNGHQPSSRLHPAALAGAAGLVALGGLAAFPDVAVRVVLVESTAAATMAVAGASSSWSYIGGAAYAGCGSGGGSSDGGSSSGGGASCGGGGGGGGGGGCGGGCSS